MAVHFGELTLDESRRQVFRGEQPLRISPKAFQLLRMLVEERPRAVSKEELQQRLWPDTFVTEGNLPSLIAELRSALADDARNPKYIRTIHGYGYSLEAPVLDAPLAQEPSAVSRRPLVFAIALLAIAVAVVFWLARESKPESAAAGNRIESLAVLPFDTNGGAASDAHLGAGMTDLVITRLSNARSLSVRPTSATRGFAGRDFDSLEVGRRLNVDAVLEGSIRTSGDRVRVTTQLFDVRRQKPIWADTFDEKRAEMFTIEDRISARVADAILLRLTADEKTLLAKRYTSNSEAYQLYIQGRYRLREGAGGPSDAAINAAALFSRAVEKDPTYALAWAGLAQGHAMMGAGGSGSAHENYPKAERAARRALELDPQIYEALPPLAVVRMFWYLDYAGAEQELQRALTIRPRDPETLGLYGYLLQSLGRVDEAHAVRTRAAETDPLDPRLHWGIANGYLTAGRIDLARKKIEGLLVMMPDHFEGNIGWIRVLIAEGKLDEAIGAARTLVAKDGRPRSLSFLAYALARAGQEEEARRILRDLEERSRSQYVASFHLILVHTALGEREKAFALLEKAVDTRDYTIRLKTEPLLDPLRSDQRFDSLLRRAGFNAS